MKVEREPEKFEPIKIILESQEELDMMKILVHHILSTGGRNLMNVKIPRDMDCIISLNIAEEFYRELCDDLDVIS